MATVAPLLATDIPSLIAAKPIPDAIALAAAALLDAENVLEISPPLAAQQQQQLLQPSRQVARDAKAAANTQVDWRETPTAHIFKVDLPEFFKGCGMHRSLLGVKKEQIKVQIVEASVLEVCGERKKEEVAPTDKWHLVERASGGFFLRRFCLPKNANADAVKAHVEDGVLTITISKHVKPEPQVLRIVVT